MTGSLLADGTDFAGYRVERTIARGGMGVVYEAVASDTGETVALKVIAPELVEHPEIRARFTQEAQISSTLDHPNIVSVRATGEYAGTPYVAMEYINGRTLREELLDNGALPPSRAVRILVQIADALDYAHARGVVHRDVKAANVLLDDTDVADRVHLVDFGISATLASASGVTRTGCWVGSLDYVSPEVIQGGVATERSDVYSLGCILYEMLAGAVPYLKDSDAARLFAHLNGAPPRVALPDPHASALLDDVIARALAKDPAARYQTPHDLADAAAAAVAMADSPANGLQRARRALRNRRIARRRMHRPRRAAQRGSARSALAAIAAIAAIAAVAFAVSLTLGPSSGASDLSGAAAQYRQQLASSLRLVWSTNSVVAAKLRADNRTGAMNAIKGLKFIISQESPTIGELPVPDGSSQLARGVQTALRAENHFLNSVLATLEKPSLLAQAKQAFSSTSNAIGEISTVAPDGPQSVAAVNSQLAAWVSSRQALEAQHAAVAAADTQAQNPAALTTSRDCGAGLYAGPDTSCEFALNVQQAYYKNPLPGAILQVYSPVTGDTYPMKCTPRGTGATCSGGVGATAWW